MFKTIVRRMAGGEKCPQRKPIAKVIWSWLGAFIGIYAISILSGLTENDMLTSLYLVGSFGASAVLIYGAPQAEFSQPRNLVGGHIICAFIGVTLQKHLVVDIALLSALAVSLSVVVMHFTRTLHPPGGATALIALTFNEGGYYFVISPIAIGTLVLLFIALVINNISRNPLRHYPRYWF